VTGSTPLGSFISPASFWKPERVTQSAWLEHAPFAYWLVEALRPRVFVELGTHTGFSYLTLCQAVARLELASTGFAIDTWEGDEHTGRYGEEVLEELTAYHDGRYASFSRLVRSRFDDAVDSFEDGSVDLLHVDGSHTYEAVRHDFDTWRAKVSSRGIVLFHDTGVREADFGVHRLWEELRRDHPAFEFVHGHGLGVLGLGSELPHAIDALFESTADPTVSEEIRQVYACLGEAVRLEFELGESQARAEHIRTELEERRREGAAVEETLAKCTAQLTAREVDVAEWSADAAAQRARADELERELAAVVSSESWRMTAPVRAVGVRLRRAAPRKGGAAHERLIGFARTLLPARAQHYLRRRFPSAVEALMNPPLFRGPAGRTVAPGRRFEVQGAYSDAIQARYEHWRERHEPDADELERQRQHAGTLTAQPLVSVVVPVFDPPVDVLRATIESALAQTYPNLELCIANAGTDPRCATLIADFARRDPRVRHMTLEANQGISANSNAALALATGEFVALLDHDDLLAPEALYRVAELLAENPNVDVVYSDEDRLTADGRRILPFLKPDWSPDFLHSYMWVGHLSVYRRALLAEIGGFRSEFDGSQDYDLMLRAAAATDRVAHIPAVLYHWRMIHGSAAAGGKSRARASNLSALQDSIDRSGRHARVVEYPWANRVVFALLDEPLVSIVVPTDDVENARACIKGVLTNTSYDRFEIVVVTSTAVVAALAEDHGSSRSVRFVRHDGEFNFSLKCNLGAHESRGDYLLFLNDDVVPITKDWIEAMLQYAQLPEIGGVSPKLLYADDSIQYAGLVTGVPDIVGTAFHTWGRADGSYHSMTLSPHNVSCLTGACMLVRARDFWEVGGWDDVNTPISHSDFDLSFRLSEAGLRLIYQPFAELRHLGHRSRREAEPDDASTVTRADRGADVYLLHRWSEHVGEDPFYTRGMRELLYENPVEYEVLAPRATELETDWWNKPRVLLVAHELSLSGAPMVLLEVATALRDDGMLVVVASPRGGALTDRFRAEGIPVVIDGDITARPESSLRFIRGFDVIGVNTVLNWRLVHAAKEVRIPCLWLVQESRFGLDLVDAGGRRAREAFRHADLVVFPSRPTAAFYERFAVSRQVVIHYGISDVRDEIAEPPAVRRTGDRVRIVSVGSLEPRKAAHILLEAIELLPPETRDRVEVVLVGRTLVAQYAAKLRTHAIGLPVEFVGEVSREMGLRLARDSDIVVCTSLDESGPLVVIEAMALGKPVISTSVGAAAEIITPGEDGELVEPGDAKELARHLERMVHDPEIRAALGNRARRRYEDYLNNGRYGRDIVSAFREVLAAERAGEAVAGRSTAG
jgi:O-antigen biosynthesis protein